MANSAQLSQYKANKTNMLIIKKSKCIKFANGLYSTSKVSEKKFLEGLDCFGKMDKDGVIITRI